MKFTIHLKHTQIECDWASTLHVWTWRGKVMHAVIAW